MEYQKQSQPVSDEIVKLTVSVIFAPLLIFTVIVMVEPMSTCRFNPEFGPQERLLAPFPLLVCFVSNVCMSFDISNDKLSFSHRIGMSIRVKIENSTSLTIIFSLRMTFRIDIVLEELLLPV